MITIHLYTHTHTHALTVPITSPEKPRRASEKGEGSKAADHKDSRSKDKSSSQKRFGMGHALVSEPDSRYQTPSPFG